MAHSVEAPMRVGMRDIICLLWSGLVTVNQAAARTRHGKIKISPHCHRFTVYSNQDIKPDCAGVLSIIGHRRQAPCWQAQGKGDFRTLKCLAVIFTFDFILFFPIYTRHLNFIKHLHLSTIWTHLASGEIQLLYYRQSESEYLDYLSGLRLSTSTQYTLSLLCTNKSFKYSSLPPSGHGMNCQNSGNKYFHMSH